MIGLIPDSKVASIALLISLTLSLKAVAEEKRIVIGVFSPQTGNLSKIGASHEYLIEQGIQDAGNKIEVEKSTIRIEIKVKDTKSQVTECGTYLDDFINDNPRAAVIIGPVRSGCAEKMLETEHEIPIITAMASATHLTENNNQWFFRANITDWMRVQQLVIFVDKLDNPQGNTSMLVYDSVSSYGKGLMKDFKKVWGDSRDIKIKKIAEIVKNTTDLPELLNNKNLFLLGSAGNIEEFIKVIRERRILEEIPGTLNVYSVGTTDSLLEFRNEGLITIGEVGFRKNDSVFFEREAERIERKTKEEGFTFFPTVYSTSRYIVFTALKRAYKNVGADATPNVLRHEIQKILDQGHFPSPNPPDFYYFDDHNLSAKFDYPIYQLGWDFIRRNKPPKEQPWIEVTDYNRNVRFLEAPVTLTVVGHNLNGRKTTISLKTSDEKLIKDLDFQHDENEKGVGKELKVHVLPGKYKVKSEFEMYPHDVEINVGFSYYYLICVIAAIVGVWSRVKPSQLSWPIVGTFIEGAIIAFGLTGAITILPETTPTGVISEVDFVNASFYGFVGGYFGPQFINNLAACVFHTKAATHYTAKLPPPRR